jgi:hypothetical protein
MEKLIDKIYDKINKKINQKNVESIGVNEIINIGKIKNVEINDENDKKLFIYKNYGIQIKNGIKFKLTFFKMINESNLEKIFELENVKIKVSNPLVIMYKCYEIWNYELYDDSYQDLLNYFCTKFNIKAIKDNK